VGTRLPAYASSMGRVLLAHLPPAELDERLARAKLVAYTDRTVTSREKLRQVLNGVRRHGFCIVDQELEIGLRSISVPVRDASGTVAAAINIGTQALSYGVREMEAKLLPPLRAAATEITSTLR
jgi:IclR family pca regulon transcriptional regulator